MKNKQINFLFSSSMILVCALSIASMAFSQTNTSLGAGALTGNTASYNTGIGYNTISHNSSGGENTAVGRASAAIEYERHI